MKKIFIFISISLAFSSVGIFPVYGNNFNKISESVRVRVHEVLKNPAKKDKKGLARVKFYIVDGSKSGDTYILEHQMWGHELYDPNFTTGKTFIADITIDKKGKIDRFELGQEYKIPEIVALFVFVTVLVFAIGRWEGLVGLFSTIITLGLILYLVFPASLWGHYTLLLGIITCILTIIITVSLVTKLDSSSFPAIISLLLVLSAITVSTIIGLRYLNLDATKTRHSRLIMTHMNRLSHGNINNLWKLLTIGIVLGTLGAIMDVAVVITSTIREIFHDQAGISFLEAYQSGMRVGQEILSTMVNTLIFAYTGVLIPIFLALQLFDVSTIRFLNYHFVGIEILRICIGFIGLSLIIPSSAAIGAFWCKSRLS